MHELPPSNTKIEGNNGCTIILITLGVAMIGISVTLGQLYDAYFKNRPLDLGTLLLSMGGTGILLAIGGWYFMHPNKW